MRKLISKIDDKSKNSTKAIKHLQSAHKHLVRAQETLGDSHDVKPIKKIIKKYK